MPALVMMGAWSGYDYLPIFLMVVVDRQPISADSLADEAGVVS